MLRLVFPDRMVKSAYGIDYQKLYDRGYRGIVYDIDNTLVPHGAGASAEAISLFEKLKNIGFKCVLVSNNDEERVKLFNKDIGIQYVCKAGKPLRKGFRQAMELTGISADRFICIGDQIFTDVLGGRLSEMYMILVKPIGPEEPPFCRFKRKLEKPVLRIYKHTVKHI